MKCVLKMKIVESKSKRGYRLFEPIPSLIFYLCCPLLKSLAADTVRSDLELLREQLQDRELIIQPTQLPLQYALIVLLLFLQCLHLQYPAVHDRGTLAAALDEVIALFLIGGDLFLNGQIEFFRHFLALLGIVNDIKAVDDQRRCLFVEPAEKRDKILENVYLIHIGVGDKVHVAGDAQLRCFKRAQVVGADRLDLLAVGAALVELKEFLGAAAALRHIHGIIIYHVVAAENAVCLIVADVCQLFVLVGMAVQGFLHQLTGENARRLRNTICQRNIWNRWLLNCATPGLCA